MTVFVVLIIYYNNIMFLWFHFQIPIMKLMQQEKEMLQRGLETVEMGRSWYLHRLKVLHEKQRNFEKASLPSVSQF